MYINHQLTVVNVYATEQVVGAYSGEALNFLCVYVCRWLVEDYAALAMLSRPMDPNALLGVVDATYTVNFTLQRFLKEE